jgi:hypothetical protein
MSEPPKAQQRVGGGDAEHHKDQRAAEQPQPHREHARDRASLVGHLQGGVVALARSGGHAHVGLDRHAHADVANGIGKERTHQKGDGAPNRNIQHCILAEALLRFERGRHHKHARAQHKGQHRDQDRDRAELAAQIGVGPGLDEPPYLAHAISACILRQDLTTQHEGVHNAENGDQQYPQDGIDFELA